MTIPNFISLVRLLCVPFLIYLLSIQDYASGAAIVVFSAFSDLLDGYVARRFQTVTKLGTLLDPTADKLLVISVLVYFTIHQSLPIWFVLLVFYRDFSILVGVLLLALYKKKSIISPILMGKISAACNFGLSFFLCLEKDFAFLHPVVLVFLGLASITVFVSFVMNSTRWFRLFSGLEQ